MGELCEICGMDPLGCNYFGCGSEVAPTPINGEELAKVKAHNKLVKVQNKNPVKFDLLSLAKRDGKSILICGPQGSGKILMARHFARNSYLELTLHSVCSSFNWFLDVTSDTSIIVDLFNTTKAQLAVLKTIISEKRLILNKKGEKPRTVDVPTFIFTSDMNHNDVIANSNIHKRRFKIIEIGE